jgi:CDP-4-dehydro-6-deoxyglucose reductase
MNAHDATCPTLLIDGPYGNFTRSEIPSNLKTVIFLATGTGVAPIRGLVEEALNTGCTADLWLYWGWSSLEDLYLFDEFRSLSLNIRNILFIPLVSDKRDHSAASYIHQVASSQHHQLLDTRIYACGHLEMVAAAKVLFIKERSFPV